VKDLPTVPTWPLEFDLNLQPCKAPITEPPRPTIMRNNVVAFDDYVMTNIEKCEQTNTHKSRQRSRELGGGERDGVE